VQGLYRRAVRSPVAPQGAWPRPPRRLGAHVLRELVTAPVWTPRGRRRGHGCRQHHGPQAGCIARTAWLSAGLPQNVPGTIDRQCGSSQQALHFARRASCPAPRNLVVAAGVENMRWCDRRQPTMVKHSASTPTRGWRALRRPGDLAVPRRPADLPRSGADQEDLDGSPADHQPGGPGDRRGRFAEQITSVAGVDADEGARRDTSLEKMAGLAPLREGWVVTARWPANSGCRCAAGGSESGAHAQPDPAGPGAHAVRVGDDRCTCSPPDPATQAASSAPPEHRRIDAFEINEAFAPVVLAGQGDRRVLTRPTSTAARCTGHPGRDRRDPGTSWSTSCSAPAGLRLQSMCEGGGQANAPSSSASDP